MISPRRVQAFDPCPVVGDGRDRVGARGDGGDELGATPADALRQKQKPSTDDCPTAKGSQKGSIGKKVIPVAAEIT